MVNLKMSTIITILDAATETSMPYNEFVLWRAHHLPKEKQILVVCSNKKVAVDDNLPGNLSIIEVSRNPIEIRKALKGVIKKLNEDGQEYAVHLHQLKSATLSQIAMLGTGFRRKTVYTIHSTFTGYALHNKIQSYFNGVMARYVTCVSNASFDKFPASIKKIKDNRIVAIRNGVDTDRIDDTLAATIPEKGSEKVTFIYVARLIPLKNHKFLLNAIKGADERAHFLFVGRDGGCGVADAIKELGLEQRVQLTGQIKREEVFRLLQESDVYVSSSTLEGMPISVLEAMCCGLPAILSDIVQHKEIGGDDRYVTCLPFDENRWRKVINDYVNMSRAEREQRGVESRKYVKQNFSLHVMHEEYSKIYNILQKC